MPITGYSDRVNHALAYAAKHHDQQVRKGLRAPYFTQPANVGIILTRYGCDDETVIAGILRDIVEDCTRDGDGDATELDRLAGKFGVGVVSMLRGVTLRRFDDDGVELAADERRDDLLARLAAADERGRWVSTANAVHDVGTLLADLTRTDFPETVWSRFTAGQTGTIRWYRRLHDRLRDLGFGAEIMHELRQAVQRLEEEWGVRRGEPAGTPSR